MSSPLWALKALAMFGPEARETTPRIVELFQDKSRAHLVRLTATEPLGRIGSSHPLAVTTLIDAADEGELGTNDNESLELRVAVIEALELARVPESLPALMIACEDPAERVRLAAATTVGVLGSAAQPAVELLASLIAFDESILVREAAGKSLSRIGVESLPALIQLTEMDDEPTRRIAVEAIGRIGLAARPRSDVVERLVADDAPAVARAALSSLWSVSGDSRTVLPHLVEALSSEDRDMRKVASDILLRLGDGAAPARQALEKLLKSGSATEQAAARRVLKNFTAGAEQPGQGASSR
jgi:HEAT repeat protein